MGDRLLRSDLYYRLKVFPITTPSLHAHSEDIPALVRHFTLKYAQVINKQVETIPPDAMLTPLQEVRWRPHTCAAGRFPLPAAGQRYNGERDRVFKRGLWSRYRKTQTEGAWFRRSLGPSQKIAHLFLQSPQPLRASSLSQREIHPLFFSRKYIARPSRSLYW